MSRARPVTASLAIVVTLAAVVAVDVLVEPVDEPELATPVAAGVDAVSGTSVCPIGDAREGTSAHVDVVRPGQPGEAPGIADVGVLDGGDRTSSTTTRLFPGASTRSTLEGSGTLAADVGWTEAPITTHRSWRLEGGSDLPPGTAAGPCVDETASTTWTIPGVDTSGGAEARLRLANPHPAGATVAVGFLTPEGPDTPTRLRNVSVGAYDTLELDLTEFLPERPDLAVVVDVLSGRVAAEGVQLRRAEIGEVDGVSLLQASPEAGETWTVPWVADGGGRASWLWISNRTDRTAPVELTVHSTGGGAVADGLAEVDVPPGTVRRVDLRGTLPEGVNSAAVTARSDGVPVTVSGAVELTSDEVTETGFAVQLAAPAADPVWTIAGGPSADRREQLRLVNPGSEPATVDVTLWTGSTTNQPPELQGIEVAPGSLVALSLDSVVRDAPSWAATVHASSGELVVSQVGSGDPDGDGLHLVATPGAPSSDWRTTSDVPALRRAPGTTQRLGTESGIAPVDPLDPPAEAPEEDTGTVDADLPDDGAGDGAADGAGPEGSS